MRITNSIPNIFTLVNLSLGIISIFYVFNENYYLSAELIILAGFMDRFDGKIARKLNATSEMGKELDSLCDLISFGLAPTVLVWRTNLLGLGLVGGIISIVYTMAGSLRLAKYNTTEFTGTYYGVPITMAGGIVSLIVLYTLKYSVNIYIIAILILVLSYTMISTRIRVKKM